MANCVVQVIVGYQICGHRIFLVSLQYLFNVHGIVVINVLLSRWTVHLQIGGDKERRNLLGGYETPSFGLVKSEIPIQQLNGEVERKLFKQDVV